MKKVLLIGYGGTIFMRIENNVVKALKNTEEIVKLIPNLSDVADIELAILSAVDSTNVTPYDWTKIATYIAKRHDEFDGFLIAHGTNTMSYTASALALALGPGLKKPVIITGSQLPLGVKRTDAQFNLENALHAVVKAAELGIAEVMLSFCDVVLRGSRTVKISESAFHAFDSPAYLPIAHIQSTGIHFNNYARRYDESIDFKVVPQFDLGVLTIDLVPGQLPTLIEIVLESGRCRGLILKSHGAGSVPNVTDFSFIRLIRDAVSIHRVPVMVSTKFMGGNASKDVNDEPAVEAIEAGAIHTADMTDVMVETKLMWLLAQGYRDTASLRKLMTKDFVGEVTTR
ncbi:MAG TPA: hypothetical protein DIC35_02100 [Candidatus Moranbacteria bacterium]|nr:hypothetical protein [Candidatus Moranbacteria bacterium]